MDTLTITFPSGKTENLPFGTRIQQAVENEFTGYDLPVIGVKINNALASLSTRLQMNAAVKPVTIADTEGAVMYRRSLCYLLTMAASKLFPGERLTVGHSLGHGYFYQFDCEPSPPIEKIKALESEMRRIVSENLPIQRRLLPYEEALNYFEENNQPDTALSLRNRNEGAIATYACGDFLDLAHEPLAPSTGMLDVFEVMPYQEGFLLRYPPQKSPRHMVPFQDRPILYSIYREYNNWGKILHVNCVGELNALAAGNKIKNFIQIAETLHNKKIAEIADRICEYKENLKIVLIAGPSSSGKTTFAKKLSTQLRVVGREPVAISLDDYFVPREETPLDENGEYNFEALEAIDVNLLNQHLLELLDGKEIEVPSFDFKSGSRSFTGKKKLRLPERSILILEGIHGLNEKLTPRIPKNQKYKIYVSALTQLNIDDHTRISTTDNRIIRRMVRDYQFRGRNAVSTLNGWPSVKRGEGKYIFPFQDTADSAFNSALDYELSVLKVFADPLLKSVKPHHEEYSEAVRLLSFLDNFYPIPSDLIPRQSILREFIGGSYFKY
ncbi:MAG: nucleoside kinase [Spirochaetales bacterium]|nr:nucleoside kinase [Spirochaetales bacterium]MCF7937055.1 nucleoside kinase [Spirochaetales bacterium]